MMQSGLQAGGWTVPAYGLVAAGALVCGVLLAMRCAQRLGLATEKFWNLILLTIVTALVGSRLFFAIENWNAFVLEPRLLLSGSGWHWGGIALAILAAALYLRALAKVGQPLPLMRVLDAIAAPALLVLGLIEIATAVALWRVWNVAAVFCVLHLAVCAAIIFWMERAKEFSLRSGELSGAVLYIIAMSLFIELESLIASLGNVMLIDINAANNLVWLAASLVVVAGALWFDWVPANKAEAASAEGMTHAL